MEDYATILENLINAQKKSGSSQTGRKKIHDSWLNLAKLEGFTERVEKYLYDGIGICGAAPFKAYVSQSDNPAVEFDKLFSGNFYSANKYSAFRLVINLLALYLNDGDDTKRISTLINEVPSLLKNKEGKIWRDVNKILVKYFFSALKPDVKLIPLANLKISPQILEAFTKMLTGAISRLESAGGSNPSVTKVKVWLGDSFQPVKTHKLSRILFDAAKSIETVENENDRLKNDNFKLNQFLETERENLKSAQQTISSLNQNISDIKIKLAENEKLLADKDAEISDCRKLVEILQNEQARNAEVALNKIASKLKIEYQDFQSALEVEMNCELGENLRQQLKNIFEILERSGLKFK